MSTLLPATKESLTRAAAALARGELVAFPTETVYGLGADASNEDAIAAVYRFKGRPVGHPLIVHLPSSAALWQWADRRTQEADGVEPRLVERLAAELWPGPVTFVLHAAATVSRLITGGQDTVAVRTPGHPVALALLAEFGGAVVAPSANRFGNVSPTTGEHVADEFGQELLILDAGPTEFGIESTIVDLSSPTPRLLRPGSMPLERLTALLGSDMLLNSSAATSSSAAVAGAAAAAGTAAAVGGPGTSSSAAVSDRDVKTVPRVPGSLVKHYAPRATVRLLAAASLRHEVDVSPPGASGVISMTEALSHLGLPDDRHIRLPPDARGFAGGLYAALRSLDASGVEQILVERPPADDDEWLAVRDRLTRAAAAGEGAGGLERVMTAHAGVATGEEPSDEGRMASDAVTASTPGPRIAIIMGSSSDWETMRHADELLERFGVPRTCQVISAHRTPQRMAAFAAAAAAEGYQVIIAGAGGAAHLPGMVAAQTHLPVLGVPVQSSALNGVDSLLSQVQMPRGVPVGTLAIGPAGALNAALLAVAILALNDQRLEADLIAYREAQSAAAAAATLPTPTFRL